MSCDVLSCSARWILLILCSGMPLAQSGRAQRPADELREVWARTENAPPAAPRLFDCSEQGLVAETARFRAAFRADAAHLEVPCQAGAAQPYELTLRLVGYSRGAARIETPVDGAPVGRVRRAVYERAGVAEIYTLGEAGFEQSFRFDQKPAGHGDLVLHIDAGGDVQCAVRERGHQALEFKRDGVPAIRYGEAIALDRGGQRVEVTTAYDGRGRIELTVPAAFVESANYPLVVDPAVGPTFVPSGSAYDDSWPDVVHDADNQRYLIVWQRQFSPSSVQIRGRIYDSSLTPVSPLLFLTMSGRNEHPSAAWVASNHAYAVAWEDGHRIRGSQYDDTTGAMLDPLQFFSLAPNGARDRRPDIVSVAGFATIVVWDRTDPGFNEPSRIVSRAQEWTGPTSPSGQEVEIHSIPAGSGTLRAPKITQDGEEYAPTQFNSWTHRLVWERFWQIPAPGDYDIWQAVVRVDYLLSPRILILDAASELPDANAIGVDEAMPSIARIGDRSLVAWSEDGDVFGAIFPSLGTSPVIGEFPISATGDIETTPAVAAGACEFTVAYGQTGVNSPNGLDIRAARVLSDGTVAIAGRPVDTGGGVLRGGLQAASQNESSTSQDRVNSALLVWWGDTGPVGPNVRDVRARSFVPVAPTLVPFGSACPGPAGSLAQIGTQNGPPIPGEDTFRITIDNGPPNSIAFLLISPNLTTTSLPGAPGCQLYAGFPLLDTIPAVVFGDGSGSTIVPLPCGMPHGTNLAFQWVIYTPGWNPLQFVASDDLDIYWSHL